ncbi:hypothetical protein [Brasilonema sp. UFV-L1]
MNYDTLAFNKVSRQDTKFFLASWREIQNEISTGKFLLADFY